MQPFAQVQLDSMNFPKVLVEKKIQKNRRATSHHQTIGMIYQPWIIEKHPKYDHGAGSMEHALDIFLKVG